MSSLGIDRKNKTKSPGATPGILLKAESCLPDVLIQSLGDSFFRTVADQLLDDLASLEHQQRGDAGDFVAHGSGAVGVDVHFADFDFALIVLGEFLDDGSDGTSGAAPGCPEVDQYGRVRFQNICVEVCVGDFDNSVACHFLSPRCKRRVFGGRSFELALPGDRYECFPRGEPN